MFLKFSKKVFGALLYHENKAIKRFSNNWDFNLIMLLNDSIYDRDTQF